jgi:AcrR family transcriptional regulator
VENTKTKRQKTRFAIVDAAYNLIIEQGYAATSMRQIAERSGLALGGLYNHFSSKEELFRALIEERHPFLDILPLLNSVEGDTIEEFMREAARTLVDQLGSHPDFLNLMLTEIVEFKAQHVPHLFEIFLPRVLPLAQHIGRLQGDMRPVPPFVLARAFLGMFFSYYITGILIGSRLPPELQEDALDHFVDIFLHGILLEEK